MSGQIDRDERLTFWRLQQKKQSHTANYRANEVDERLLMLMFRVAKKVTTWKYNQESGGSRKSELFTGTSAKASTPLRSLTNAKPPHTALCRAYEVVEMLAKKTFTVVRKISDFDTHPKSRWIR